MPCILFTIKMELLAVLAALLAPLIYSTPLNSVQTLPSLVATKEPLAWQWKQQIDAFRKRLSKGYGRASRRRV